MSFGKLIPKNERERELALFWYNRGAAEAMLLAEIEKNHKKVTVGYRGRKKKQTARVRSAR